MGAAPYIIDRDFGRPRLAVSWEVDRACKALVQKALPWVEHRGDFTRDSPRDVADLVLHADPNAEAMVVWCAAPPCQDFSRIVQGAGHQGDRGRLFEESVAFMDELRAALKSHRFAFLYENVEMSAEAAKVSSEALGVQPVFVCLARACGGSASTGLAWSPTQMTARPWSGRRKAGGIAFGWPRFGPRPIPSTWAAWRSTRPWPRGESSCLAPRRRRRPTTGGPSHGLPEDGPTGRLRPAWLEGGRQFAPWHYTVEAMLQDAKGVLHIPPPEVKEQLHHIPPGYTAKAGADAKTRHRMIGNGWHWGVASRLLGLLVMTTWAKPVAAGTDTMPGHHSLAVPDLGPSGLGLRAPPRPNPQVLGEGLDEDSHWAAAARMAHSLVGWPSLEPALEAVLEFRREWRHDLARIRQDVLNELRELVEAAEDDTAAWLAALPAHVRATYVTKDRPRPFQGLVFDRLLRGVGYPAADDLQHDVNAGFDMLGSVRPAPGWRPRSDERYAHPEGLDRLRRENPLYVERKSARPRDKEYTQALLDELVAETRLGRVIGPCAAPDHWAVPTVALPSVTGMGVLRQPPPGDCFAALSFAICQIDDEHGELKLRRGEDWRQSGQDATMGASDVPTHHFLGDIVDLVLRAWAEGWDPVVFGHDLQNAYRQWAVRHPGHCGTFLPSAAGVTLWFHFAMCFGAAASVWNFNRAADAVQMLLRALLLVLLGHFVDDFNGVDATSLTPPTLPSPTSSPSWVSRPSHLRHRPPPRTMSSRGWSWRFARRASSSRPLRGGSRRYLGRSTTRWPRTASPRTRRHAWLGV